MKFIHIWQSNTSLSDLFGINELEISDRSIEILIEFKKKFHVRVHSFSYKAVHEKPVKPIRIWQPFKVPWWRPI